MLSTSIDTKPASITKEQRQFTSDAHFCIVKHDLVVFFIPVSVLFDIEFDWRSVKDCTEEAEMALPSRIVNEETIVHGNVVLFDNEQMYNLYLSCCILHTI